MPEAAPADAANPSDSSASLQQPDEDVIRRVGVVGLGRPMLQRLGQRLFAIGDDAGLANLFKLAANALTATTLECMGEVLALLEKGGVNSRLAFGVLTNSLFDSRVHEAYGGKIVEGRFSPPGMAVPLALKDVRLVHDRLVAMLAHGWNELDWSALGLLAAVHAGIGHR